MVRDLTHPRLAEKLADFFPQTVTIQQASIIQDAFGEGIPTWSNVVGLVGLPCQLYTAKAGGSERRGEDFTVATATHFVLLRGYYPAVLVTMRALVGAIVLNILAVTQDSQTLTTRLECEAVTT